MVRKGLEDVEYFQLLATRLASAEQRHGLRDCRRRPEDLTALTADPVTSNAAKAFCCAAVVDGREALSALGAVVSRFPYYLRIAPGRASQMPAWPPQDEPYADNTTLMHERLDAVAGALESLGAAC